jgi:DNA-binding MarR family transcriptional regulator
MTRLEEAGYIEVEKMFVDKRPNTRLSLTEAGRRAFEEYRKSMRGLLA